MPWQLINLSTFCTPTVAMVLQCHSTGDQGKNGGCIYDGSEHVKTQPPTCSKQWCTKPEDRVACTCNMCLCQHAFTLILNLDLQNNIILCNHRNAWHQIWLWASLVPRLLVGTRLTLSLCSGVCATYGIFVPLFLWVVWLPPTGREDMLVTFVPAPEHHLSSMGLCVCVCVWVGVD